jgi:hypothetical protein
VQKLNHVDSQAQINKNSSHDPNKRRETKSHRYSEGGKVREKNAQVETRDHA